MSKQNRDLLDLQFLVADFFCQPARPAEFSNPARRIRQETVIQVGAMPAVQDIASVQVACSGS